MIRTHSRGKIILQDGTETYRVVTGITLSNNVNLSDVGYAMIGRERVKVHRVYKTLEPWFVNVQDCIRERSRILFAKEQNT